MVILRWLRSCCHEELTKLFQGKEERPSSSFTGRPRVGGSGERLDDTRVITEGVWEEPPATEENDQAIDAIS